MSPKVIVVVLLLLAAAGGGVYYYQTQAGGGAAPLQPAQPIDPPAGAYVLDNDATPRFVYSELQHMQGGSADWWIGPAGWDGEVARVWKEADGIGFQITIEDPRIAGQLAVRVHVPGAFDIKAGDVARVRGRVTHVESSRNPVMVPHMVYVRDATVIYHRSV
ncbi:MAG: hypothetical protein AAFX79_07805 [Planctomycetota bacterium]